MMAVEVATVWKAVEEATVWKAVELVTMMLVNDMTNDEDDDVDDDVDDETDDKNEMTVTREPKHVYGDHNHILARLGFCRPYQHRVDVMWMTEGGRWAALEWMGEKKTWE